MATIDDLVVIAHAEGLSGTLTDWSKAQVWWFDAPMPEGVREAGDRSPNLKRILTDRTPHDRANDGFFDSDVALAISFPRQP